MRKKGQPFFLSFLFQNFIFTNHLSDWKKMKWRFNKKNKKTMISHFHQMETCEGFLLKYKMWNCLHFIFFCCFVAIFLFSISTTKIKTKVPAPFTGSDKKNERKGILFLSLVYTVIVFILFGRVSFKRTLYFQPRLFPMP